MIEVLTWQARTEKGLTLIAAVGHDRHQQNDTEHDRERPDVADAATVRCYRRGSGCQYNRPFQFRQKINSIYYLIQY